MHERPIALVCVAVAWTTGILWAADAPRPADPKRSWISEGDRQDPLREEPADLRGQASQPQGRTVLWYRQPAALWVEEYKETDPHHRHTSHLFALHPGRQITVASTPDLTAAVRKVLEVRGDGGTGWSMAWKVNFWARLHGGGPLHIRCGDKTVQVSSRAGEAVVLGPDLK